MQPLGQMNILVVEDRPEDLEFTRECLNSLGVGEPIHVASMTEMKAALLGHNFDVILLDLCLPETQGLDTVKLAADMIGGSAPFIVLTGMDDFAISKDALKLGAKDYLIKGDFGPHELQRSLAFATFGRCNPKRHTKRTLSQLWRC